MWLRPKIFFWNEKNFENSYENGRYYVGQFVKKLRRTIVDTGYRVDDIKYLYWSEQDIDKIFDRYFTSYTILNKDYKDLYNYSRYN